MQRRLKVTIKRFRLAALAVSVLVTLCACGTFSFVVPRAAPGEPARYRNGQQVEVVAKVIVDRNQVTLQDQDSPAVFRLVGLQPAPRKALSGLDGRYTRVRLRIVSVESARVYNAQFIAFATRPGD
jgi:hypothetical protein